MSKIATMSMPLPTKTRTRSRFADEGTSDLPRKTEMRDVPLAVHSGPKVRAKKIRSTAFFYSDIHTALDGVMLLADQYDQDPERHVEFLCQVAARLKDKAEKVAKKLER